MIIHKNMTPERWSKFSLFEQLANVDYFAYDNQYGSTDASWQNYFFAFNYAAALMRGK